MIISLNRLYEAFDDFNRLMFDSELPSIEIKISHSVRCLGKITYTRYRKNGKSLIVPGKIFVSNAFNQDWEAIEDTLIHEMIHLKQINNNVYSNSTPHGSFFRSEMNRINSKFGRHVSISHISERDGELKIDKNERNYFLIAIIKDSDKRMICRIAGTRIPQFVSDARKNRHLFDEVHWYVTMSSLISKLPKCLSFRLFIVDNDYVSAVLDDASTFELQLNIN